MLPTGKVLLSMQNLKGKTYTLSVYDVMGKEVFKEREKITPPYFTKNINCTGFSKGMYIVKLQTEKEWLVRKFV